MIAGVGTARGALQVAPDPGTCPWAGASPPSLQVLVLVPTSSGLRFEDALVALPRNK